MRARGRTCVGCRRRRSRGELVRLVRTPGGEVRLDAGATEPGRGAYVCPDADCLRRARKKLVGALRADRVDFAEIDHAFEELEGVRGAQEARR